VLGAWFLGERARRLDWCIIAAVLAGVALFFLDQLTIDHVAGNLIALAAGVDYAASTMAFRKVALASGDRPSDPLRPMLLGNAIGAVLGAPFLFASPPPGASGWAALVALGVLQQACAFVCFAWAIRRATALEATLLPIVEPIASPVWVAIAFGERPGPWALAGGAIVVGAVTLRTVLGRVAANAR
jgi:drug/metabolite transporter (DMT)-like permease